MELRMMDVVDAITVFYDGVDGSSKCLFQL